MVSGTTSFDSTTESGREVVERSRTLHQAFQICHATVRGIAERLLRREPVDWTLTEDDLVSEVYLKLERSACRIPLSQEEILRLTVRTMRSVLVDHARRRRRRLEPHRRQPLDSVIGRLESRSTYLPDLDLALRELSALGSVARRASQVFELRFLCGWGVRETAQLLQISEVTVKRDWRFSRAWLRTRLAFLRRDDQPGSQGLPRASDV